MRWLSGRPCGGWVGERVGERVGSWVGGWVGERADVVARSGHGRADLAGVAAQDAQ